MLIGYVRFGVESSSILHCLACSAQFTLAGSFAMTLTVLCTVPVGQHIFEMSVQLNVQFFIAPVGGGHELRFGHVASVLEDLRDGVADVGIHTFIGFS